MLCEVMAATASGVGTATKGTGVEETATWYIAT